LTRPSPAEWLSPSPIPSTRPICCSWDGSSLRDGGRGARVRLAPRPGADPDAAEGRSGAVRPAPVRGQTIERLSAEASARAADKAPGRRPIHETAIKPVIDVEKERQALADSVTDLAGENGIVDYRVQPANSATSGVDAAVPASDSDLVIIGASHEWTVRQVLFGSIPDIVADQADCSVLMVRRYMPNTLSTRAAERFKRLKESVGMTTSPEEAVAS